MRNEKLLKESLNFINENPDCLFNEVPQHLIEYWTTDNFNNKDLKGIEQWTVFMHILLLRKEPDIEFEIEIEKLKQYWQNVLDLISVNNLTEVKIKPFKIFDIENFENLDIIRIEK